MEQNNQLNTDDYLAMLSAEADRRIVDGHRLKDVWQQNIGPVTRLCYYFANDNLFHLTKGYSINKGLLVTGKDSLLLMEAFKDNAKVPYQMVDVPTLERLTTPTMAAATYGGGRQDNKGECFLGLGVGERVTAMEHIIARRWMLSAVGLKATHTHLCSEKSLEELKTIYSPETISYMLDMCNHMELY